VTFNNSLVMVCHADTLILTAPCCCCCCRCCIIECCPAGLAEPLAVILLALFFPGQIDERLVDCMLAGVGGIMAFLSFHELLPLAFQHAGKSMAVGCLLAGMGIMSLNLHLLNTYVLGDLH
jgi:hypothetical protein